MPTRNNILGLLKGGDRRSIGSADEVAVAVSKNLAMFPELFKGLWSEDPLVRMRAADATEKITRSHPDLLQRHKRELLGLMVETKQQELRWHLAAMVPKLELNVKECELVRCLLNNYLQDRSSIVKTSALQALADLAAEHSSIRLEVLEILRQSARNGTPAMKARSRKLLLKLEHVRTKA
jgi:HEAT repeat protein